jgi:dihydrofolate synthase/folylpolyglutamate synthase
VYIYFQKKKVDIAIIEAGLGGTTDCTNIINPLVSVLANIGYDHQDILGDTLTKITEHKARYYKSKW